MIIGENVPMRTRIVTLMVTVAVLLLVPCRIVYSQNRIEYAIQIEDSGSAAWTIRQTGTDIQSSFDTLIEFRNRVISLVEAAKSATERPMAAVEDEFSLESNYTGSYVTVEYRFYWENFSKVENSSIIIGDVFQVQNFFLQLYGEGEIYMTYPSRYTVATVTPAPSIRDDSIQMLEWPGAMDFDKQDVRIVLNEKTASLELFEVIGQNAILISSLAVIAVGSSAAIYTLRHRKKREAKVAETTVTPGAFGFESDEEKVVKLLKSSGGSSYQSAITDHLRFSRAKTSQLLAVLEDKGIVRRYKKGRDKIVVLVEKDKREI
jgi:uncharacterized membrane protein